MATTGTDTPGTEPDVVCPKRRVSRMSELDAVTPTLRPPDVITSERSPVRESRTPGSARGAGRNPVPTATAAKLSIGTPTLLSRRKATRECASTRACCRSREVADPGRCRRFLSGNRETSTLAARELSGPHREGDEPKPMTLGVEGSRLRHSEADERGRATGRGARGAKGGGRGERGTETAHGDRHARFVAPIDLDHRRVKSAMDSEVVFPLQRLSEESA